MVAHHKSIKFFVSPGGRNKINEWLDGLEFQAQAELDVFIHAMAKTAVWGMPHYRPSLQGYSGLGELRLKSKSCRTQLRLIGFFKENVWIALLGCTHKDNRDSPQDALETAERRRKEVLAGIARLEEYE